LGLPVAVKGQASDLGQALALAFCADPSGAAMKTLADAERPPVSGKSGSLHEYFFISHS